MFGRIQYGKNPKNLKIHKQVRKAFSMVITVLESFAMLFVVMNPISTAVFFAGASGESSSKTRRSVALKAVLVAFGILFAFAIGGDDLLQLVGVRLFSLKIAGGLLLFLVSLNMVLGPASDSNQQPKKCLEEMMVFPLAMPIIAGPASILTTVVLIKRAGSDYVMQSIIVGIIIVILLITFLLLLFSSKVAKRLGRQGNEILTRILGILLCSLSVEMIIDGLTLAGVFPK
jgi:multiple antibiotic resistance protein